MEDFYDFDVIAILCPACGHETISEDKGEEDEDGDPIDSNVFLEDGIIVVECRNCLHSWGFAKIKEAPDNYEDN